MWFYCMRPKDVDRVANSADPNWTNLTILFKIAWWTSAGTELTSCLSACAVLLYVVLIFCVPFLYSVWVRKWNSIVWVPDSCLFIYFAPWGTVWSESTLFAQTCLSKKTLGHYGSYNHILRFEQCCFTVWGRVWQANSADLDKTASEVLVPRSHVPPPGVQTVAGSLLGFGETFFRGDLVMKSSRRSFSPYRWLK